MERKPSLEKILAEKLGNVAEEVQYELSKSIGGSM